MANGDSHQSECNTRLILIVDSRIIPMSTNLVSFPRTLVVLEELPCFMALVALVLAPLSFFFVKSQIVDIFVCCCFQIICCVFCVYIFLSLCWIHSKSGQNRIVKRLHQLGEITQFQTKKSPKLKLTERTQKHFSIFFSDLDLGHRTSISPPEIYIYSCSICSQL